ncbi:hypothetical protein OCS_06289 [Ophiocordyceps sinensis CO18]|nr:hypothetical protein OCS_06289 [Ophiocordyceps sinensis CO18]
MDRIAALEWTMEHRFSIIDKRFVNHERVMADRFKQVDKRLNAVDKRFDDVDKRFDDVDKRFDDVLAEVACFDGAVRIYSTNAQVREFNRDHMECLHSPCMQGRTSGQPAPGSHGPAESTPPSNDKPSEAHPSPDPDPTPEPGIVNETDPFLQVTLVGAIILEAWDALPYTHNLEQMCHQRQTWSPAQAGGLYAYHGTTQSKPRSMLHSGK